MFKRFITGIISVLLFMSSPVLARDTKAEITCLAHNIYFEAGNQPNKGKIAVATIVMNRLKDGRFGNNVCEIIHKKVRRVCQFSWVCSKSTIKDRKLYESVVPIAERVYTGKETDPTRGSLYFRSIGLKFKPQFVVVIGKLRFYKV